MKTSSTGRTLIENSEGLRLHAYQCPAGVWTIGYGHTSAAGRPEVYPGLSISKEAADAILAIDLGTFEHIVTKAVHVTLTQPQFDALVSFVFNLGEPNFRGSTLLRKLNAGDYASVPSQLLRWTHSGGKVLPGLVARRHAEAALWDGMAVALPHAGPVPKVVHVAKTESPLPPPAVLPPPPKPPLKKANHNIFVRSLICILAMFGVTAAHAADVAVTPFATTAIDSHILPSLSVGAAFVVTVLTNVFKRYFDQKTSALLADNVNNGINWAISAGVKYAEQYIEREDFHFNVDGWVAGFAVQYAQSHFPDLAKKAGGDIAEKVQARLASHADLLALKAKAGE